MQALNSITTQKIICNMVRNILPYYWTEHKSASSVEHPCIPLAAPLKESNFLRQNILRNV
jgi:hypothetical protein